MDILNDKRNEYISKLEALKQINDLGGKDFNLNNFLTDDNDIFSQMIELSESLLINEDSGSSNSLGQLKNITVDAIDKVNAKFKDIMLSNIKKSFFVGDGVCGVDTIVNSDVLYLKPSEIDYLDILKINPVSNSGKILYENDQDKKQKVNLDLYGTFSGTDMNFKTYRNNSSLFETEWVENEQQFKITLHETNVGDFFNKYYSSISLPQRKDILKNNLLTTLKGESLITYNKKVINLNKILDKIFKNCNQKNTTEDNESFSGVKTNFIDESGLFVFDDVEGFVVENDEYDSVMKFSSCYEIEVPVKNDIIDEIIYYDDSDDVVIDEIVDDSIDKISKHTEISSNYELNLPSIKIGILKDFILNLPKTFMRTLFTPKIILPIVMMYKKVKNFIGELTIEDLFTELKKLFVKIIKDIFWNVVSEVWKKLKNLLTKTLKKIGGKFIKNKTNRYLTIITRFMSIINMIPLDIFDNCNSIYDVILKTIDSVINTRNIINIPNPMLLMSDQLNGYSQDRAVLNIVELLNKQGISTSPIYGEENNLLKIIDSVVGGNMTELDENGYIKIVLKGAVLPSGPGGTVIPPGMISGVGKLF